MGRLSGNQKIRILFLSTYPPRACGIATFTQDLVGELAKTGEIEPGIAAVSNGGESYPPEVKFDLNQQDPEAYPDAAEKINRSGADLLMVEHEYGIYGGPCGSFLLKLTGALKLPYCVTLHTVLPEPSKRQRDIVHGLGSGCEKLVTMAPNTVETLKTVYGVDPEKIAVIHHGVPNLDVPGRDRLKRENGLEGRFIVSTFGLLGPGKGLEYGIEATARVAKKHPEVLYLILGQTHPDIRRREGEKYREKLERTVENFGISRNVR
ncbi:MAG TPA: glycosyl transferase family 1, partial [Ruminococcaceae bacterium]|nr:glycosyl transferase family 1 [Oscillospiraceae bacterium]